VSLAWEVTIEDVQRVLAERLDTHMRSYSDELQAAFDVVCGESDRVEKAALYGDCMDEQADLADAEIEQILRENDLP
jgi:hypothetical protein